MIGAALIAAVVLAGLLVATGSPWWMFIPVLAVGLVARAVRWAIDLKRSSSARRFEQAPRTGVARRAWGWFGELPRGQQAMFVVYWSAILVGGVAVASVLANPDRGVGLLLIVLLGGWALLTLVALVAARRDSRAARARADARREEDGPGREGVS